MKILNLYSVEPADMQKVFVGEDDIEQKSVFDLFDLEGQYDTVICRHSLSLLEPDKIPMAFEKLVSLVKDFGELWVIAPALEWFATQCYVEAPSPVFHQVLFGSTNLHNRCGFTLAWLRALVESNGMSIQRANQEIWEIPYGDQKVNVLQNVVVGRKYVFPQSDTPSD
jgi:hypothetical protein